MIAEDITDAILRTFAVLFREERFQVSRKLSVPSIEFVVAQPFVAVPLVGKVLAASSS